MSRDGLQEENLHSQETVRISARELDSLVLSRSENESGRPVQEEMVKTGDSHRRKRYQRSLESDRGNETPGNAFNEAAELLPIRNAEVWSAEMDSGLPEETADAVAGRKGGLSEYSSRMRGVRSHSTGSENFAKAAAEVSHNRKKRQVQARSRKEKERKDSENQSSSGYRDGIKTKQKREQLNKEQKKKSARLSFEDEDSGMVRGTGMGIMKNAASTVAGSAVTYAHGKGHEA